MTEPQDRKNWESLWDDLGLPTEPPVAPTANTPPPTPIESPDAPPPPVEVPGPSRGRRPRSQPSAAPAEAAPEPGMFQGSDLPETESTTPGDDARPRRRRRRRRRGERSDGSAPSEAVEAAGLEAESITADAPQNARGHRRRDHVPTAEIEDELTDDREEADEGPFRPAAAESEDDEPLEFSDWTVPSWNDLIASLYRPPDR